MGERHKGERKVKGVDDQPEVANEDVESVTESLEEVDIAVEGGESSDEEEEVKLESIKEEECTETPNPIDENVEQVKTKEIDDVEDSVDAEVESKEELDDKEDVEPNTGEDKEEEVTEFPDTDVKVGFDRLGSVEIRTKTVSESEEITTASISMENYNRKTLKTNNPSNNHKRPEVLEVKKSENVRGKKGKM